VLELVDTFITPRPEETTFRIVRFHRLKPASISCEHAA